jgi:uncharacterized membrane protein YcaP (DUF421 family)
MRDLITFGTPPLLIILRCTVVYVVLLVALRLTGKRQLGQFTPFDFAVLLIVSNAVQNAMIGPDTSLVGGILGAAVLFALNYLLSLVSARYKIFGHEVLGDPTVLINNGHLIMDNLRRERVDADDVLMAMREHGVDNIAQVKNAILETDGTISIINQDTPTIRTKRRVRGRGHQH